MEGIDPQHVGPAWFGPLRIGWYVYRGDTRIAWRLTRSGAEHRAWPDRRAQLRKLKEGR